MVQLFIKPCPPKEKGNLREYMSFYNTGLDANIKRKWAVVIETICFLHCKKALFPKQ